jgi:tRNA(His) 5'-end guanylyltransferase
MFDTRIFQISNSIEVENYFIWRQQDATRNSISAVAQSLYKGKNDLIGKSSDQKQEMIFQKGINWNDYPSKVKHLYLKVKNKQMQLKKLKLKKTVLV